MKRIILACILSITLFFMIYYHFIEVDKYAHESQETSTEVYVSEITSNVQCETRSEVKPRRMYDVPLSWELQEGIYNLCIEYDFNYALALAIIKTESNFDVNAIGDNGNGVGLCQIWPYWWGDFAYENGLTLTEPIDNVEVMLLIITGNLKNHTLAEALQMYNTGKPYGSAYAERVFNNLKLIESEVVYVGPGEKF